MNHNIFDNDLLGQNLHTTRNSTGLWGWLQCKLTQRTRRGSQNVRSSKGQSPPQKSNRKARRGSAHQVPRPLLTHLPLSQPRNQSPLKVLCWDLWYKTRLRRIRVVIEFLGQSCHLLEEDGDMVNLGNKLSSTFLSILNVKFSDENE